MEHVEALEIFFGQKLAMALVAIATEMIKSPFHPRRKTNACSNAQCYVIKS